MTASLKAVYISACREVGCRANSGVLNQLPSELDGPQKLTLLDLSRNVVGKHGFYPVLQVARAAPCLTCLNAPSNLLSNDSVKELVDTLGAHPSLRCVDVSGNPITHCAGKLLAKFVRYNTKIVDLRVQGTLLSPAVVKIIGERCEANRALLMAPQVGGNAPANHAVTTSTSDEPREDRTNQKKEEGIAGVPTRGDDKRQEYTALNFLRRSENGRQDPQWENSRFAVDLLMGCVFGDPVPHVSAPPDKNEKKAPVALTFSARHTAISLLSRTIEALPVSDYTSLRLLLCTAAGSGSAPARRNSSSQPTPREALKEDSVQLLPEFVTSSMECPTPPPAKIQPIEPSNGGTGKTQNLSLTNEDSELLKSIPVPLDPIAVLQATPPPAALAMPCVTNVTSPDANNNERTPGGRRFSSMQRSPMRREVPWAALRLVLDVARDTNQAEGNALLTLNNAIPPHDSSINAKPQIFGRLFL